MGIAIIGKGSAIYEALKKLDVVPDDCRQFTIKVSYDRVVTITYECNLIREVDYAVGEALESK
jgi:hypothetical protein